MLFGEPLGLSASDADVGNLFQYRMLDRVLCSPPHANARRCVFAFVPSRGDDVTT